MDRPRPRLVDVAAEAGVSAKTASLALQQGKGSERTRARISEAAQKLGYTKRAREIQDPSIVIVGNSNIQAEYVFSVQQAVYGAAQGLDYQSRDTLFSAKGLTRDEIERNFGAFTKDNTGGFLIYPDRAEWMLTDKNRRSLSVVVIDEVERIDLKVPQVLINAQPAMTEMVSLLKDQGHTRFAFLGGRYSDPRSSAREVIFQRALQTNDLEEEGIFNIGLGDSTPLEADGASLALELSAHRPLPTAIFVLNDHMALGAIDGFRRRGISVPKDVSLIGFGGTQITEYTIPRLSTISVNPVGVSRVAAELLAEQMQGEVMGNKSVKAQPLFRGSTASAKA